MILTDREIKIAVERKLIQIEPPPKDDISYSSSALDLTLDAPLRIFDKEVTGVDVVIDPAKPGFDATAAIAAITKGETIGDGGFDLQPHILILAWTIEAITLPTDARL